jgi:hypothetical protein
MSLKGEILTILQNQERTIRRPGVNAEIPGAGTLDIFSIIGGPVQVKNLFGVVTADITGAATIFLYYTSAGGTLTALSIVSASINGDLAETIYRWDGSLTALLGVLAPTGALGIGIPAEMTWSDITTPTNDVGAFVLLPGVISIDNTGGAAVTAGVIDWYLTYKPLLPASQVAIL